MKNFRLYLLITIFLVSCGGIQLIGNQNQSNNYRKEFLSKIQTIKTQYASGNAQKAITSLNSMNDSLLWPAEKAFKYNLIGVLFFSEGKIEESISSFDTALATSDVDDSLTSQIYLNMASSYYKLDFKEKSYSMLMLSDYRYLKKKEAKNYHFLHYKLAKSKGKEDEVNQALVRYLGTLENINEIRSNGHFQPLLESFLKMTSNERADFVRKFDDEKTLVVAYLAYLNAEKIYYEGDKSKTKDYLDWIADTYSKYNEVIEMIKNFSFRLDTDEKIDPYSVGVVLPLTGKKANFGQRALFGIDSALKSINRRRAKEKLTPIKIYVKDSQGSGAVGGHVIKELIDNKHIAAVIGGLFSSEAYQEYLESKQKGVFFVSLSSVDMPKISKDYLLLEIRGSIESQINQIFSDQTLNTLGRKAAILYPSSKRGQSHLDEFWRKATLANVEVVGVQEYSEDSKDFREPVKQLLGLSFSRGRQEEREILSEIYSLEDKSSVKRIQVLGPQVDFDWLYLPSFPEQARLIVPSFSYFDAFKVNFIGDPSWGESSQLMQESFKFENLFYVGGELNEVNTSFYKEFIKIYKRKPKILEVLSYDSMKVVGDIISNKSYDTREEFDHGVKSISELEGMTGKWVQTDGLWLKNMQLMMLKKGEAKKVHE